MNKDIKHQHKHEGHNEQDSEQYGLLNKLLDFFRPHAHSHHVAALDPALANDRGIWALKISLVGLLMTGFFQVIIVIISDSVALLADTIHNFSDALTAIPLWLAFVLARRARNNRYTYGYGKAEDIAGTVIVVMIFGSAVEVFYQSIQKIIYPQPVSNLEWVAVAAIIGFIGNELVAMFRIKVGKEIGSAALVADGLHSRTDGFTSLGVLAGAIGVWLGFPLADPITGLLIGFAILVIVWNTAKDMWYRLMDAVDPVLYDQLNQIAAKNDGVMDVHGIAVHWVGHRLWGEMHLTIDCQMPTYQSHKIADDVQSDLFKTLPALMEMTIHVDPCECDRLRKLLAVRAKN